MVPWGFGPHWMKPIPKLVSNAAGCIRPPTFSTNFPKPNRAKPRQRCRKSGWPPIARLRKKHWTCLCAITRQSIPRLWLNWKKIGLNCSLSMIFRPNTGGISGPPMPLSPPSLRYATGLPGRRTVYHAAAFWDWVSRCCSRLKNAGLGFMLQRKSCSFLQG
uniref:Uncharacterized protein n=1 Tax=Acidithiobacillus ferrooxidans TaxID=920 RepID=Q56278_ACIFR|nr:unknown [Acidithiobacillus ferrooxidans]